MLGFILGTMTGGAMGVFAMCLLISGKRAKSLRID